ncbi:MAG: hypothetical protein HDT02_03605 [Bacteroidales bacterium]|nr:hypothetical protein [Bacteroidales bacterium]
MKFSEQQLNLIEELAAVFLPVSDIASILDVEPFILKAEIRNADSDASRAYRRGKAQSKVAIRTQEMKLAQIGSPLGIESVARHLTEMELDE